MPLKSITRRTARYMKNISILLKCEQFQTKKGASKNLQKTHKTLPDFVGVCLEKTFENCLFQTPRALFINVH